LAALHVKLPGVWQDAVATAHVLDSATPRRDRDRATRLFTSGCHTRSGSDTSAIAHRAAIFWESTMIEFQHLSKSYGSFAAVKPLALTVRQGEVFGFLGPNGAGKTTTIRMMMGILVPTQGKVLIDGLDCQADATEVKRRVGYLPDNPIFYDFLRGREILQFVAEMHGFARKDAIERADRLLTEMGLDEVTEEFAVNYSMGMKKKLALACALIHSPAVLILDEPINGLDPRAARDVQQRLLAAAANGTTVFVSTHLLDMAEKLCDRVGIIHHGALVATGTLDEIRRDLSASGSLEDVFLKVTDTATDTANGALS
jgi:ABC-2 type transport system ATP-binding protein